MYMHRGGGLAHMLAPDTLAIQSHTLDTLTHLQHFQRLYWLKQAHAKYATDTHPLNIYTHSRYIDTLATLSKTQLTQTNSHTRNTSRTHTLYMHSHTCNIFTHTINNFAHSRYTTDWHKCMHTLQMLNGHTHPKYAAEVISHTCLHPTRMQCIHTF